METSFDWRANSHFVTGKEQHYDALLARLDSAYSFGMHRDSQNEDELQERLWLQKLRFANLDHLPEAERRLLSRCKRSADRARAAAVDHDFLEAWRELTKSESSWRVRGIAEDTSLLGQVESVAAQAVVEYQSGEYSFSRVLLRQASHIDQLLTERFRYSHTSVHAIHLLGKLVQLEAAQGHFGPALAVAAAALVILSGAPASISLNQWVPSPSLLAEAPPSIRRMLSRQIAVEVGAALLFASPAQAKEALNLFYEKLGQAASGLHLNQMTQQWLHAKALTFKGSNNFYESRFNAEAHLQRCASFLLNSRRSAETLWLLGALDAAQRCASIDSLAARRFRKRTFNDLAVYTQFPARLRTCWSRIAESLTIDG